MNKKLFLILLLSVLSIGHVFANSHSKHYGKVSVTASGEGSIYLSTTSKNLEEISEWKKSSELSVDCGAKEDGDSQTFYCYAKPEDGYHFVAWKESNNIVSSSQEDIFTLELKSDKQNTPTERVLSAVFEANSSSAVVTYLQPQNGSYSVVYPNDESSSFGMNDNSESKDVNTIYNANLSATPNAGYKVFGWYVISKNDTSQEKKYISYSSTANNVAFEEDVIVGVDIVTDSTPLFAIKSHLSVLYKDLNVACNNTKSGDVIVLVSDGILPKGNYEIPDGRMLLIPYDNNYTAETTAPTYTEGNQYTPIHPFKTLTFASDANITVKGGGSICVAGQQEAGGFMSTHTDGASGCVSGNYGCLNMSTGGSITLESGSNLYAWGYIVGQNMNQGNNTENVGIITAKKGSKVYENFVIGDWRGGGNTACMGNTTTYKVFPMSQYYLPNIEVPLTIEYGAFDNAHTALYASSSRVVSDVPFVGSSNSFFTMTSGTVKKWYDPQIDKMTIEVNGNVSINGLSLKVFNVNINSSDFVLPINSSLYVRVNSGTVDVPDDMCIFPGAVVEISKDAVVNVKKNVYLYDLDDWDKYARGFYYKSFELRPTAHFNHSKSDWGLKDKIQDAKLIVDGKLILVNTGHIYTTKAGADICSSNSGIIEYQIAPNAESNTYQVIGEGDKETEFGPSTYTYSKEYKVYYTQIPVVASFLHNSDDTYTTTANVPANSTFKYVDGYWVLDGVDIRVYKPGSIQSERHYLDEWTSLQTECPNAIAVVEKSKVTSNFDEYFTNIVVNNNGDLSCNNFVITDKEPIYVPDNFKASKLTYTRTGSNTWGTVCMPFALESNDDVQYYKFKKLDLVANCMTFEEVTEVEPNTPAIYSLSEGITELNLSGENCELVEYESIPVEYDDLTLYGVLNLDCATLPVSDNSPYYYIAKNKFWQPTKNQVTVYPYRAYFMANNPEVNNTKVFDIVKSEKSDNEDMFGEMEEQQTSILILPEGVTITQYYNAAGVKVAQPQKGVNIIKLSNGQIKKIIIK